MALTVKNGRLGHMRECREIGLKHRHAKTCKEHKDLERKHGVRYTVLANYDAVWFCNVDPMHY